MKPAARVPGEGGGLVLCRVLDRFRHGNWALKEALIQELALIEQDGVKLLSAAMILMRGERVERELKTGRGGCRSAVV